MFRLPTSAAQTGPAAPAPKARHLAIAAILVFLLTFVAFERTIWCQLLYWDDTYAIINNPHITRLNLDCVAWALTDVSYVNRYHPLPWLSWALDYQVSRIFNGGNGLAPWVYHLDNVLLHALTAVLLLLVLARLLRLTAGGRKAGDPACLAVAVAATLFWSLHPLRVEVVAWATARVHELPILFVLLSLLFYLRRHNAGRSGAQRLGLLGASTLCYVLSLLSYASTLGYVVVLLAIDLVLLGRGSVDGRFSWRALAGVVGEKLIFALAAVGCLAVNFWARTHVVNIWGSPPTLAERPLWDRALVACYMWGHYLWKPWYPYPLTPYIPTLIQPRAGWPLIVAVVLVLAISGLALSLARRLPALPAWWVCHLAILVPMLGLTESNVFPCDRYSYGQGILWSMAIGWVALLAYQRGVGRWMLLGVLVLAVLLAQTLAQEAMWSDTPTLLQHVIDVSGKHPSLAFIYVKLGAWSLQERQWETGEVAVRDGLKLAPRDYRLLFLGSEIYVSQGEDLAMIDPARAQLCFDQGAEFARALVAVRPDDQYLPMLVTTAQLTQTLPAADALLKGVYAQHPSPLLLLYRAEVCDRLGRPKDGLPLLRDAVASDLSLRPRAEAIAAVIRSHLPGPTNPVPAAAGSK